MSATEQRYIRAIRSSHLKLKTELGDVDTVIAAGMSDREHGALLMRLRAEYDTTRRRMMVKADTLTEQLLILAELKTLHAASQSIGAFAHARAQRDGLGLSHGEIRRIGGAVLDAWLDRRCHECAGRGFNGGSHRGEPTVRCRACRGTGARRLDLLSKAPAGQALAELLLAEMDRVTESATRRMNRLLRNKQ